MLEEIRDVLIAATLHGSAAVLRVRAAGDVATGYKDARELVTSADKASDAAILCTFESLLPHIDPSIAFHLEESGPTGAASGRIAGADPLDGTNHFAAGGNLYCVQAHFLDDGVPLIGVICQPEAFLPLAETPSSVGRLVYAVRGHGTFLERITWNRAEFRRGAARRIFRASFPATRNYTACVPVSTKMSPDELNRALRVYASGLVGSTVGTGNAGGNVLMILFGGQHVYANFGAGDHLDLIPPQVVAEEAGLTVWDMRRSSPRWHRPKQPVVFAPTPEIAEQFLRAAGL